MRYVATVITIFAMLMISTADPLGPNSRPSGNSADSGRGGDTLPSSQPTTGLSSLMDRALYEALYAFMRGDIDNAFDTLDKAIDSQLNPGRLGQALRPSFARPEC